MSLARAAAIGALFAALPGCGGSAQGPARHGAPAQPAVARSTGAALIIPAGSGHLAAMAGKAGMTLRDKPGGRVVAHLEPRTQYGSPTVVWAARQRGRWLGVVATAMPNNRLGWLDAGHDRPRMWRSPLTLVANLSTLKLELRRGARVLRTMPVTIGHPDTPTPTGSFEVTDKLVPRANSAYGCCILALSGHQPKLRPGWAGGDRIAIHGSPSQTVGATASAGCLRARDRDLRALMKVVPLGTPVLIRA